jgi:DNA polymerase-3 subunit delta
MTTALAAALKSGIGTSRMILLASSLPARNPIRAAVEKKGQVIDLPELKGAELRRWTEKELRMAGFEEFPEAAVEGLSVLGDESPDQLVKLIEHLALYLEGKSLRVQDIAAVFPGRFEPTEYELLDAIAQRNIGQAEALLSALLRSGKNPFMMISLFVRTFSTYLSIRSLLDRQLAQAEVRQTLGIAPWLFQKHLGAVKGSSLSKLRDSLTAILRADSKLKNRSLGPESIFSELIFELSR